MASILNTLLTFRIPEFFKSSSMIPVPISAFLISILPMIPPMNAIIFVLVFLAVYFSNFMGLAEKTVNYCRFNIVKEKKEISMFTALKNAYYIYLFFAYGVNHMTLSKAQFATKSLQVVDNRYSISNISNIE